MTEAQSWWRRGAAAALVLLAVGPSAARAQFVKPPPAAAYAIRNATLVAADGTRHPGMTVVVRGHFIEALGPGVAVPADAQIVAGDSLMIYPGIVDGAGLVEYAFPEVEIDRDSVKSWNPPRAAQGFTPHLRVADHLTATDEDLAPLRKQGVVAVAVQPTGPLMPGRGAVVLLRKGAESPEALAAEPVLGPVMSLQGRRGTYPSTLMGVIAFYKQVLLDATRNVQIAQAAGAAGPAEAAAGMMAPGFDADYAVLEQAVSGNGVVYFRVDDSNDIRRALRLADQFKLKPVIVGGGEAWKVADELKSRDVPVLVSLDFPEPERWDPESEEDTASADKDEGEPAPAAVRERRRIEALYSNPGKLAAAGVRFALTSGAGEADIREGARKAIEYGLSEADALRAVTTSPATIYGIPSVVRIAKGQPATFIVTDGPLFGEDTEVVATFVEGGFEKGGEPKKAANGEAADVAGTWSIEGTGGGGFAGTLTLEQDGATVTGTIETEQAGETSIENGIVNGNEISFSITIDMGGQSMTIDFKGTVDGDDIEGTGSGGGEVGSFEWTAHRTTPGGF